MTQLDGPRAQPQSGGPARHLVVLLHGLGADGDDLIQLTPYLGQALPDAAFVSPHAPEACDMAPFGRQWFSLQDQSPAALEAGTRRAAPVLDAFLDAELTAHGLSADRLALLGFSQGGMMALHVGLRRSAAPACICAFSAALPGGERLADEIQGRPPVLLVHGEADEIIPVQALGAAEAALNASGVPVTSERRPGMGHGIDERGIQLAVEMLRTSLPGASTA